MTQEEIKHNFSQNLIALRKASNLTQLALAEQLNYSDKAISKWEVGSVLPDVEVLTQIADFFGTTVNDLIYPAPEPTSGTLWRNHIFITLFFSGLVWFIASILFFILHLATSLPRLWLIFIFAIPASAIVLIVFTYAWFTIKWQIISVSLFYWGTILSIFLIINNPSIWFIFVVGIVGQPLIIFKAQLTRIVLPILPKRKKKTK